MKLHPLTPNAAVCLSIRREGVNRDVLDDLE